MDGYVDFIKDYHVILSREGGLPCLLPGLLGQGMVFLGRFITDKMTGTKLEDVEVGDVFGRRYLPYPLAGLQELDYKDLPAVSHCPQGLPQGGSGLPLTFSSVYLYGTSPLHGEILTKFQTTGKELGMQNTESEGKFLILTTVF